jgi:hypothetical protein
MPDSVQIAECFTWNTPGLVCPIFRRRRTSSPFEVFPCETLRDPLYVVYGEATKKNGVQFEKCFTWNVFIASHNETNNRVITTYHQLLDVKFALNISVEAFLYNCFPLLLMYTNRQHSCI